MTSGADQSDGSRRGVSRLCDRRSDRGHGPGIVVQVDTPAALYQRPRTSYVAGFIDAGSIIFGNSRVVGDTIEVTNRRLVIRGPRTHHIDDAGAIAAFLPHNRVGPAAWGEPPSDGQTLPGHDRITFPGSVFSVHVRVDEDNEIRADIPVEERARTCGPDLRPGSPAVVTWNRDEVVFVADVPSSRPVPAAP